MHILFLTHYFPPEVNAPASRTYEHCKRWVAEGHKVTVVTCVPNHPGGKIYPGYRNRLFQKEEKDQIKVLRLWTYLAPNKGFLKRSINFVVFMLMAVLSIPLMPKTDVVISTSPQFFCGLAGFFASRLKRVPWILEIRDLWPDSILAVGAIKNKSLIKILEYLELFVYKKADRIVALTNAFKVHIIAKKIAADKIEIITNGVDLSLFRTLPRNNDLSEKLELNGKFVVSYFGTHGMAHGLETVFKAAKTLEGNSSILFLLAGDGAERDRLLTLRDKMMLKNVMMLSQFSKDKMPYLLASSDACMVLLIKNDLFKTVIPSKIFEAMAMRRPIILGVDGESKKIIDEGNCGICIEPENSQQLAQAVLKLYDHSELSETLGDNGRKLLEERYDRNKLAKQYLKVIESVIGYPNLFEGSGSFSNTP
jgi:glycosyltransferase involved in cell wall biosynthesis